MSTHDNPRVQKKTFFSLKPVNLKTFYVGPYLTHEREIKFAEKEMEKFCLKIIIDHSSVEGSASLLNTLNSVDNSRGLSAELHDNTCTLDNHIPFVEENIHNPIMWEDFPRSIPHY